MTKREGMHRLLDLVLDINGDECRTKEKTGDKPTAFLHFSGHVNTFYVSLNKEGWAEGSYSETEAEICFQDEKDWERKLNDAVSLLEEFKKAMEAEHGE